MQTKEMVAALRRHPFDKDFVPAHVERLGALAREAHFDRDQMIFREGDEWSQFYLIIEGRIRITSCSPDSVGGKHMNSKEVRL